MQYEVWAVPPKRAYRVRIRVYQESHWQVAHWTATALGMTGYTKIVVKEVERPVSEEYLYKVAT